MAAYFFSPDWVIHWIVPSSSHRLIGWLLFFPPARPRRPFVVSLCRWRPLGVDLISFIVGNRRCDSGTSEVKKKTEQEDGANRWSRRLGEIRQILAQIPSPGRAVVAVDIGILNQSMDNITEIERRNQTWFLFEEMEEKRERCDRKWKPWPVRLDQSGVNRFRLNRPLIGRQIVI